MIVPCSWKRGTAFSGVRRKIPYAAAAAAAKSFQSCPTLCDPIDGSPPGFPVPGTLQARTLEWAAISFSNAWKWKVKVKSLSRVRLLATPWTAAYQFPLSVGFSRHEYCSELPLPSPKIPYRKRYSQMIRMCAYIYTGKQKIREQAQPCGPGVLQLKARKVNSPLELRRVFVCLCFVFISIWGCLSYHFLPGHSVLLSVWRLRKIVHSM